MNDGLGETNLISGNRHQIGASRNPCRLQLKASLDRGVLDHDRDSIADLDCLVFALVLNACRIGDLDVLTDATILIQDGSRDQRVRHRYRAEHDRVPVHRGLRCSRPP